MQHYQPFQRNGGCLFPSHRVHSADRYAAVVLCKFLTSALTPQLVIRVRKVSQRFPGVFLMEFSVVGYRLCPRASDAQRGHGSNIRILLPVCVISCKVLQGTRIQYDPPRRLSCLRSVTNASYELENVNHASRPSAKLSPRRFQCYAPTRLV